MTVSSDKKVIATGDESSMIKIWDYQSLQERHTMTGNLSDGIRCMAFSPSGALLVVVDASPNHNIALYSVVTGICLSFVKGSND